MRLLYSKIDEVSVLSVVVMLIGYVEL